MTIPMTKAELAAQCHVALKSYLDQLDALVEREGIFPSPRVVMNDPRTADEAEADWDAYKAKEQKINDQYFASQIDPG